MENYLNKKIAEFQTSTAKNEKLCSLAWAFRKSGKTADETKFAMESVYTACEDPQKHESHTKEIERAVDNVFSKEFLATANSPLQKWRASLPAKSDYLQKEVEEFTKNPTADTREILSAWHYNRMPILWHGDINEIKQDNFTQCKSFSLSGKYITLQPLEYKREKLGEKALESKDGYIWRSDDYVKQIDVVCLELDHTILDPECEDKNLVWEDTKLLLEKLDVMPVSITFSGNRSFHCVFRLFESVSVDAYKTNYKQRLEKCLEMLGSDKSMATLSRTCRIPRVIFSDSYKFNDEKAQRCIYFDDTASTTMDDLLAAMEKLIAEIYGVDYRALPKLALPVAYKPARKEGDEGTWIWQGQNVEKFLSQLGIGKYEITEKEQALLQLDDGRKIINPLTPDGAIDAIYTAVKTQNPNAAIILRDNYSKKFRDLATYAGNKINVKKHIDTKNEICIPYKNGVVVINSDTKNIELVPYSDTAFSGYFYSGLPTLEREFEEVEGEGEFQLFVKKICGMTTEGDKRAKDRYKAICCALGYFMSSRKEAVNYNIILTDEVLTENEGGTGKSLLITAIKQIKNCIGHEKNASENQFSFSKITRKTDVMYFDEVPKNFEFREFFEKTTGDWRIEHKGVDGVDVITYAEAPKLIFATNFYPRGVENSYERRRLVYEITNYYNNSRKAESPEEFGHLLFTDWDADEWKRFDFFMAKCALAYLQYGLQKYEGTNTDDKKLLVNIPNSVVDWLENSYLTEEMECRVRPVADMLGEYNRWCQSTNGRYDNTTSNLLGRYVTIYCKARGIEKEEKNRRIDGVVKKTVVFKHIPKLELDEEDTF